MEIYLIRHTTPAVEKNVCYGQSDLDLTETFVHEAAHIRRHLPAQVSRVFSSPLQRCRRLAEWLFPGHSITCDNRLKEIHCGSWELKPWDAIERRHLDTWMSDLVHTVIPDGESYWQLYLRAVAFFNELPQQAPLAIVTHGGVIRSLLAYLHGRQLHESFDAFSIRYGCTIRINTSGQAVQVDYLHNPETPAETHRPRFAHRG